MNSLIEKMARDECRRLFKANDDWIPRGKTIDDMVEQEWRDWIGDVKAQIEKVLDHLIERTSLECIRGKICSDVPSWLKAAKEELK